MEWSDHGVILAINKFSEQSAIISCLTQKHGLHKGFIKNIKSKSNVKSLFIGNLAHLTWSARLENHLGSWKILSHETITPHFYHDQKKLTATASICELINILLPENEAHEQLFANLIKFLYLLKTDGDWLRELAFLELFLLNNIGYGLDLSTCTLTGSNNDLYYISPTSGKAVGRIAGQKYHDKLFLLHPFMLDYELKEVDQKDIIYALNVTKHFFEKYISSQNNLSIPKIRIILQDIL